MKTAKQRLYRARQLALTADKLYRSAWRTFDVDHPLTQKFRESRETALATARAVKQEIIDDHRR